jgi:hypothetical protein
VEAEDAFAGGVKMKRSEPDTGWLLSLAARLRKFLRKTHHPLALARDIGRATEGTDGWALAVGKVRSRRATQFCLWYDRYFGVKRPRILWYGFAWESKRDFVAAFKHAEPSE